MLTDTFLEPDCRPNLGIKDISATLAVSMTWICQNRASSLKVWLKKACKMFANSDLSSRINLGMHLTISIKPFIPVRGNMHFAAKIICSLSIQWLPITHVCWNSKYLKGQQKPIAYFLFSWFLSSYSFKTRKFFSLPHIITKVLCGVKLFKFWCCQELRNHENRKYARNVFVCETLHYTISINTYNIFIFKIKWYGHEVFCFQCLKKTSLLIFKCIILEILKHAFWPTIFWYCLHVNVN